MTSKFPEPAADILNRIGEAVSPSVEAGVARLGDPARAALTQELEGVGRLAVVVDVAPVFAVRLILKPESGPALTLATLLSEPTQLQ